MTQAESFLTIEEVALRLAVSPHSVRELVRKQELRAYRVGRSLRFSPADIATYLESVRVGARG